jgi:F-type H+-transporting ATPase subunit b
MTRDARGSNMFLLRLVFGLLVCLVLSGPDPAAAAEAEPADAAGPVQGTVENPHATPAQPGHGSPAGDDGEGGGNPLDFKADLAIWTAVVFLVLMGVLWRFAWGPIRSGLEKREQGIADQITQAEQSNQKARELLGQYEQKLAASRDEVRGILDGARHDAEQLGREMLSRAKEDAQAEQRRALAQIDAATAEALKELARQSSALAVQLAGKILRAELKPEDHARLVQQAVTDFRQKGPGNGVSNN